MSIENGSSSGQIGFAHQAPCGWGESWLVVAVVRWAHHPRAAFDATIVAAGAEVLDAVCDIGDRLDEVIERQDWPPFDGPGLWRVIVRDETDADRYRLVPFSCRRVCASEAAQLFALPSEPPISVPMTGRG